MRFFATAIVLAITAGTFFLFSGGKSDVEMTRGSHVALAPEAPIQINMEGLNPVALDGRHTALPFAAFDITAVLLGRERYRMGRSAGFSPIDMALGWGIMFIPSRLESIRITQGRRFYFWRYGAGSGRSNDQAIPNSSNIHMIPATPEIRKKLLSAREGDIIRLTGLLVDVSSPDGWRWKSSRTREDTGNGACEILLVQSVDTQTIPLISQRHADDQALIRKQTLRNLARYRDHLGTSCESILHKENPCILLEHPGPQVKLSKIPGRGVLEHQHNMQGIELILGNSHGNSGAMI